MSNQKVMIQTGICGAEQESSYMNGTLQNVGSELEMTIHTYLDVPEYVSARGQEAVSVYVLSLLESVARTVPGLTFEVRIGPSGDEESENV